MIAHNIKTLWAWYSTQIALKNPVPEMYYREDNCPSSAQQPLYGRPLVHLIPYSELSHVVGTQCYVLRPTCHPSPLSGDNCDDRCPHMIFVQTFTCDCLSAFKILMMVVILSWLKNYVFWLRYFGLKSYIRDDSFILLKVNSNTQHMSILGLDR